MTEIRCLWAPDRADTVTIGVGFDGLNAGTGVAGAMTRGKPDFRLTAKADVPIGHKVTPGNPGKIGSEVSRAGVPVPDTPPPRTPPATESCRSPGTVARVARFADSHGFGRAPHTHLTR